MATTFQDLTSIKKLVQIEFENPKATKKLGKGLGCKFCPMDTVEGIHKIKGLKRIKGKKIFLWFQSPGAHENDARLELVGPVGKWLWKELEATGIAREDCDIQYVVRCRTAEWSEEEEMLMDRKPSSTEIKCCSIYNGQAVERNQNKAKVHIVFGELAGRALLGREYKKAEPIFWSTKLNAKVVLLEHPSYFIRGYGGEDKLQQFRARLRTAISFVKHYGRYSFLKQLDYQLLDTAADVKEYFTYIKKFSKEKKRSVVVDIEEGWLYKNYSSSKLRKEEIWSQTPGAHHAMLVIGFCHAPGRSRTVVLDHPNNKQPESERRKIKDLIKEFLEDKTIEKVMHYGSSDLEATREILGIRIKNYWFDTNYGTYLLWPALKKYGLDSLSKEKLPEFAGYKEIIKEYIVPGKVNYATIPLKIHRLYNGGDCDVTKRLEILTRKPLLERDKNSKPLLRTYRHCAFTLRRMTPQGPLFDYKYASKFKVALNIKVKHELKKIRKLAKNPDLNPGSHVQVKKVIYQDLRLPEIEVKRKIGRTDENTLKVLQAKTKHPFIESLLEYRGLCVMKGTQLKGYKRSADTYYGRLRTIWWLTGAITGRLRSGGKDEINVVNLQNIPKNPAIKNLLISDTRWRRIKEWFEKRQYKKILRRKVLMVADYSAIELRVIAELAEPKFVKIFNSGKSIHGLMGSGFTDWTYDQIETDEEIRTKVKNINFGIPYGLGKQGLFEGLIARGTKITRKESDKLYDAYFAEYDGVANLQVESRAMAEENNEVVTMYGFHRPIQSSGESDRGTFWGNQAINSRIQGTAHQYLLFAMALLHTRRSVFNRLQEMSMEIHDALAFYSQVMHMQETYKQLKKLLEKAVPEYVKKNFKYKLKVPLECEIKAGFRLGVMVKYKGEEPLEFIEKWIKANDEASEKINTEWEMAA